MIRVDHITNALSAVIAMARGDTTWSGRMEMSSSRVFQSFWAWPLAVPAMLLSIEASRRLAIANPMTQTAMLIANMPVTLFFALKLSASLATWAAEVGVLVAVAQRRGMGWKISPMIIAANWSKFAYLGLSALGTAVLVGVGAADLAVVTSSLAFGLLFYWRWGIFRQTLDMSTKGAAGMQGLLVIVYVTVSALVAILMLMATPLWGEISSTLTNV